MVLPVTERTVPIERLDDTVTRKMITNRRRAIAGFREVRALAKEGGLTVGEPARLGCQLRLASHHLQALRAAGVVSGEAPADDGRRVVYRLTDAGAALVQAGLLLEG